MMLLKNPIAMKTKFILIVVIIFTYTASISLVNGQTTDTKNIKAYYEFAKSIKLTTLLVVLDNDSTSPVNDTIKSVIKKFGHLILIRLLKGLNLLHIPTKRFLCTDVIFSHC